MTASKNAFSGTDRDAVYRAIFERRDMRHFLSDPVDEATMTRLLEAAHHAPSVGYMQPWRFVRIGAPERRARLAELVEEERLATADALGARGREFMALKVEGIRECPELWVMALTDHREAYVFGRRTMPDMDLASASCAIQNMWLAARAEGLGLGWVSLFDPDKVGALIEAPLGSRVIAVLCIGHVEAFYSAPMLEQCNWDRRRALESLIGEDRWPEA
ncbi:5,6-dimethylbenzimidazole synthase [Larsenimonas suaedae]|uniref:5,6-dimethylbenzimidazole synthase n=1 Tax=Larsenimonas suaedae TaxID=1851019 RepID=A0ABU1GY52_9GAMM|nr:5,6-dimethylbenzimidazole synthase [Larsenimonas suaedae]MCM2971529.1 5,6-dimethylbenzimidazole synthase [Larsenimonas suaedae]MDR5896785.1 5,6-dimethylbenzimidazole synthase [Larsenimonas suaedae]